MALFPPPHPATENILDWQSSFLFLLTGAAITTAFVLHRTYEWVKIIPDQNYAYLLEISARLDKLENHRRVIDRQASTLEALRREVDSVGRRVDDGFERINK